MPPKQTPYQFSKGLSYSQDIPPFLCALKGLVPAEPGLDAKRPPQFCDGEDEEDEVPDDEKPTIVQLSKKHLSAADVERITNGEEIRPGNTGIKEEDDEESGRPKYRRPIAKDKKRKGGESEGKGNNSTMKYESKDKKKRKKEKKVPLVHLSHLEDHDGEEEEEYGKLDPTETKQARNTKASPRIKIPQYDGAIDEVERPSAAADTGKSENTTGPVWSGLVSYYDDDEGDNDEEDAAGTTALPGLLHYSVEDDSQEEDESEKQLQTAILRVPPVGPAKRATPKSPSDRSAAEVFPGRPTAIPSTFSAPQSENLSAHSSLSSSPKNNPGPNLSSPRR